MPRTDKWQSLSLRCDLEAKPYSSLKKFPALFQRPQVDEAYSGRWGKGKISRKIKEERLTFMVFRP
jgi:hypothetical protein